MQQNRNNLSATIHFIKEYVATRPNCAEGLLITVFGFVKFLASVSQLLK